MSAATALLRAARPLHFAKNLLAFAPLVLAHRAGESERLAAAAIAFVCLCLVASAGYLANDLADREGDRADPVRRARGVAAGEVSVRGALVACAVAAASGLALAWTTLPGEAARLIGNYLLLTLVYSFALKRVVGLDVLALVALYLLRLFAGGAAAGVPVSDWLWSLAAALFASLALLKRALALRAARERGLDALPRRGYRVAHLAAVERVGVLAAVATVVVLALYLRSDTMVRLYGSGSGSASPLAWLACVIVGGWLARMWHVARAGRMGGDPVLFALRDPASLVAGAALVGLGVALSG
ncbi:Decaprenyl-phosphate phosphoribosyltransferase [Planctomycetes bacterium Pla163]|uniref:Decaprenyl-phosphate phosphoribosyltransferase n=1 Tax=Rohdeia mirabilis TaxID=2528008 RepID=A0A518CVG6_9BACT|nr:Decaprenyl-phosphate phosphoribosyltransferase [Planctomycetes bacterium Pla163]